MADKMYVRLFDYLDEGLDFIHHSIGNNTSNKSLVHCKTGISRFPTTVIAFLMQYHNQSLKAAYDYVKQRKNNVGSQTTFFEQQFKGGNNDNYKPSISLHDYLLEQMLENVSDKFTRDQISTALKKTKTIKFIQPIVFYFGLCDTFSVV